jgi:thiol-disulfide isomerase/thioredoxin
MSRFVALSLVVFSGVCAGLPASGGDPAPVAFPLSLVDPRSGGVVEVRAGAPLLHLVFFATWCPPCRDELPRLLELDARWGSAGYRLVLVAVSARQSADRLREFAVSANGAELLFDSSGEVQKTLGATQLPTHVLIDENGTSLLRAPALGTEVESVIESVMTKRRSGR